MLTKKDRDAIRGMLADKQGIGSIAEELECSVAQIQALADAKPKAVRERAAPRLSRAVEARSAALELMLLPCLSARRRSRRTCSSAVTTARR